MMTRTLPAPAAACAVRPTIGRMLIAGSAWLAVSALSLRAQNTPPPAPPGELLQEDALQMNELVITGGVVPKTKLETSRAVTTVDRGQLERLQPRSTAEALKLIPGFYVESSGGENNNNLFARGAPADGGYVYVMMQEDGLPVISESDFQFSPTDNYSRITNWVQNIEALRGGPASIFQSSAPIGIINLISREGTQTQQGEILFQTGDYGLLRTEMWTSGPLGPESTYAIGGFYRVDDGIRDPGFTANKGGQLAGNIRRELPDGRGYIKASAKILSDRTAFQLPIPLANPSDPRTIPGGPDIHDGPSGSLDIKTFRFPNTPIGDINWDLGDGIRVDLSYFGTEVRYEVGDGLVLENRNRFTTVDKAWIANPPGIATPLQMIANSLATSASAAGQFAAALDPATGNYRFRLTYPGAGDAVAAANAAAAAQLNGNGLGMDNNFWHSGADMRNFQNDARLIQTWGDTVASLGFYYAYLEDERLWQWNRFLTDVSPEYRRLDVTYLNAAGAPVGMSTFNGISQVGTLYRSESGEERDTSVYVNVDHDFGRIDVNAGYRYQYLEARGNAEGVREYDLNPTGGTNPALRGAQFGDGTFTSARFKRDEHAFTVGANYTLDERTALFARFSDAYRMPDMDDLYNAALDGNPANREALVGPTPKIKQYEFGVKYARSRLAFFVTLFRNEISDQPFADFIILPDGTTTQQTTRLGIDVNGVEVEGIWTPISNLSLQLIGTYQEPENSTHNFVQDPRTGAQLDIHGNRPIRIPKEYVVFNASYALPPWDSGELRVNAGVNYVGKRFTDRANLGTLDAFAEFSAGASFSMRNGFTLRVQVSNLFNSDGLTEGDPRVDQTFADPNAAYSNFRPVLPRSIVGSVSYAF